MSPAGPREKGRHQLVERYVAVGDSFTEGVGDRNKHLPNGVRGWADRVAEQLAKAEPGWEYANLAVRSKRLRHIVHDQVERAVELQPTLITLYAGGNDILDAGTDMTRLMDSYEQVVARLSSTGARLLLFTGYDVPLRPLVGLFRGRNAVYNAEVRRIADDHGAELVDYWAMTDYRDKRMWAPDRLHMSKAGHKRLAAHVLDVLGVEHTISPTSFPPAAPVSVREWERMQRRWVHDWVLPLVHRKIRRVTLGDSLEARWPVPVTVPSRGGLRALVRED